MRAGAEKERHDSQTLVQQLQIQVDDLHSQRRVAEEKVLAQTHQIEKLALEKAHTANLHLGAAHSVNQERDAALAQKEHEQTLRSKQHEHELDALRKAHELELHRLRLDHEAAKSELWKRAQEQMDAKIDEVKSCMFTKADLDIQIKGQDGAQVHTRQRLLHRRKAKLGPR